MIKSTKKFIALLFFALPLLLPVFVHAAAYSDYSNIIDKTVTAVSGCVKNEDCSGDTPCCNPATNQCVEQYGDCNNPEPKSAVKSFSIIKQSRIGACLLAIQPNQGKWRLTVNLIGNGFGNAKNNNDVTFASLSGRMNADYTEMSWAATSINVKVPSLSQTGEVKVLKDGIESNGVQFSVTGGEGDLCNTDLRNPTCQPNNNLCSYPLLCNEASCRCQMIPGTGESCDRDQNAAGCQLDNNKCRNLDSRLFCDEQNNCSCQPIQGLGAPCNGDEAAPACQPDICQTFNSSLSCDTTGAVDGHPCTCQIINGLGEPCGEGENVCEDKCDRFANARLFCDIGGIINPSASCTCQIDPNIGVPCYEGADIQECKMELSSCEARNTATRHYFCDPEGTTGTRQPCTCQIDPNIGAPCYEGATAQACEIARSTCENRNTSLRKYLCQNETCTCQLNEIRVIKTVPSDGETDICRNVSISAVFNQLMDRKTLTEKTVFLMRENQKIDAVILSNNQDSNQDGTADQTVLNITPLENLEANVSYRLIIKGGPQGVKETKGLLMTADYSWNFITGSEICQIHHIDMIVNPPGLAANSDLFKCAGRNDCAGDQYPDQAGNQHIYTAQAKDKNNRDVVASYQWTKEDSSQTVSDVLIAARDQVLTAQNQNGQATLFVQAEGAGSGIATTQMPITVFLCENPWPLLSEFPFEDTEANPKLPGSPANFSTYYCRDIKSSE